MQYSSLPTALPMALLAVGAQAIPTTNGVQAQPPRGLIPRGVSQHYKKRNLTEPTYDTEHSFAYTMYNCGAGRVHLDQVEKYDAQEALKKATKDAKYYPEDNNGCFTASCGDAIAFLCGPPGGDARPLPGNLPGLWDTVSWRCGSFQPGLVGSFGETAFAAGYMSASQKYVLDSADIHALRMP
ncbi:hypothetical protein PG988_006123 [Apiospora saccharicola]